MYPATTAALHCATLHCAVPMLHSLHARARVVTVKQAANLV